MNRKYFGKALSLLVAICLLVGLMPAAALAAAAGDSVVVWYPSDYDVINWDTSTDLVIEAYRLMGTGNNYDCFYLTPSSDVTVTLSFTAHDGPMWMNFDSFSTGDFVTYDEATLSLEAGVEYCINVYFEDYLNRSGAYTIAFELLEEEPVVVWYPSDYDVINWDTSTDLVVEAYRLMGTGNNYDCFYLTPSSDVTVTLSFTAHDGPMWMNFDSFSTGDFVTYDEATLSLEAGVEYCINVYFEDYLNRSGAYTIAFAKA